MISLFRLIRSIVFYLVLAVFTILWTPLCMLIGPFLPFRERYILVIHWWTRIAIGWCRICCGIRFEVQGEENIPDKACVIMANHQSTWETFFLQCLFYPQVPVIKKSLLDIPFFGWAFRLLNPIAIDRRDRRSAMRQIITQGTEVLENGNWVLIFPEGTRRLPGQPKNFSRGGASLAVAARQPVLPVAHNAGEHWPNKQVVKYPGTIKVAIGPLIDTEKLTIAEVNAEAERWIFGKLAEISKTPMVEIPDSPSQTETVSESAPKKEPGA